MKKVNLKADIVTYGVLAMNCATHEEAQEFLKDLSEKRVKYVK